MKAIKEIELFGEDTRALSKFYTGVINDGMPGLGDMVIGSIPPSGWVAEIAGTDPKYKYVRCFLKPKKDYSRANSKGSRGVYAEYVLESGRMYEVKEQVSNKRTIRYFCTVDGDGNVIDIPESEVKEWLKTVSE